MISCISEDLLGAQEKLGFASLLLGGARDNHDHTNRNGARSAGLEPLARERDCNTGLAVPEPQKVCKIMTFMAVMLGLGLLFC